MWDKHHFYIALVITTVYAVVWFWTEFSIGFQSLFSLIPLDSLKCYLCQNTSHTSQASSPPVLQKYAGLVHLLTNHKVLYVPIPFAISLKECIDRILYFMLSAVYFKCLFSSVSVQLYFGLSSWVNLKLREVLLWSEMATGKYFSICLMFC